jgi:alkanesulfonate monooxygenase SsuD/methylene tetrahydromethanopterin reductase-like flavin-dependent oxidoreductase (luciferase family)
VKYGIVLPGGTARQQLELALLAEANGWDGVFVWEAAYGVDAWTLLAAMAARTSRVRLGTMLTPLPWRRPWKLASQVVTLDNISDGRAILAVGLGAVDSSLGNVGDETDRVARAELLDEGLDIVRGLWEGRLRYEGKRYHVDLEARTDLATVGKPVQARIPIWVVGAWPRPRSMRRVLRCDGILPYYLKGDEGRLPAPEEIRDIRQWVEKHGRSLSDFDVVMEGETPAGDRVAAAEQVRPWAEAGCTWWMETRWAMPLESPERLQEVRERLEAGPPA